METFYERARRIFRNAENHFGYDVLFPVRFIRPPVCTATKRLLNYLALPKRTTSPIIILPSVIKIGVVFVLRRCERVVFDTRLSAIRSDYETCDGNDTRSTLVEQSGRDETRTRVTRARWRVSMPTSRSGRSLCRAGYRRIRRKRKT